VTPSCQPIRHSETLVERRLFRSPLVSVRDVHCLAACGSRSGTEDCSADVLVFPRRGAFVVSRPDQEVFADAGTVLFFRRGESYRVSHPIEGGDDCTTLTFNASVLAEALGSRAFGGAPAGRADVADAHAHAALIALRTRESAGLADLLETEARALTILARTAAALRGPAPTAPARGRTLRRHRDAVFAVRAILAGDFTRRIGLASLADAVGLSPFHLSRTFARLTGTSIHRHRVRLRLRAATARLAEGQTDLTELALDLGFASHSHFTDAFGREYGLAPSAFRQRLGAPRITPRSTGWRSSPASSARSARGASRPSWRSARGRSSAPRL
jgi:AraC family transcriptional regulator